MVTKLKVLSYFVFLVTSGCISGCSSFLSNLEKKSTLGTENSVLPSKDNIQKRILFLADNQRTLVATEPIFEQSKLAKSTVKGSAHRGPAMESFSLDVLHYILTTAGAKTELTIHAGDLLNNSCRSEFEEAMCALQHPGTTWDRESGACPAASPARPVFIAPGNHDGYYLGITSPTDVVADSASVGLLNELRGWAQACTPAYKKYYKAKSESTYYGYANRENQSKWGINPQNLLPYSSKKNLAESPAEYASDGGYASNILDKYSYILAYLESIGIKNYCGSHPSKDPIADSYRKCPMFAGGHEALPTVRCASPDDEKTYPSLRFLKKICWTEHKSAKIHGGWPENSRNTYSNKYGYTEKEPWLHFLIQWVAVPSEDLKTTINIILLDTASYQSGTVFNKLGGLRKTLGYGAADNAEIGAQQRRFIQEWIDEIGRDERIVLVGHHPIKDLSEFGPGEPLRRFFADIARKPNVDLYVSGDNHDGYDVRHTKLASLREANLGSTIDAPIEYALGGLSPSNTTAENERFELARYLMTPAEMERQKDGIYGFERNYFIDDGIYRTCKDKDYLKDIRKVSGTSFGPRLKQPSDLSIPGLPYLQFWRWADIRQGSLYVYKINRLVEMIDQYKKIYVMNDMEQDFPVSDEEIKSEIRYRGFASFGSYSDYMFANIRLAEILHQIEDHMAEYLDNDDVRAARLCSALIEAHQDSQS